MENNEVEVVYPKHVELAVSAIQTTSQLYGKTLTFNQAYSVHLRSLELQKEELQSANIERQKKNQQMDWCWRNRNRL